MSGEYCNNCRDKLIPESVASVVGYKFTFVTRIPLFIVCNSKTLEFAMKFSNSKRNIFNIAWEAHFF